MLAVTMTIVAVFAVCAAIGSAMDYRKAIADLEESLRLAHLRNDQLFHLVHKHQREAEQARRAMEAIRARRGVEV